MQSRKSQRGCNTDYAHQGKKNRSLDSKKHCKVKQLSKLKSQPAESEQHPQHEGSANSSGSTPHTDSATNPPAAQFNSVFVSSLSGCTHTKPKSQTSNVRKLKRAQNRLGQRARQRQWEEMYGTNAKHLAKRKKAVSMISRSSAVQRSKCSEVERPKGTLKKSLHPSWEARRKKKEQEANVPSFQGQRTVFPDSD